MAAYTSTQDGAWNTGATWVGGVAPNANDDTATIAHKVTYDSGVSATTWGNVTVNSGGMLVFPIDSSWKILFNATGILTINSGGEIRTGTTTATGEIGAAYLGQIHFPQGAAARYTFVLNDGGTINLFGADIYGTTNRYVNLKSNWTTGNTLYVTGDITSKTCWSAGKVFYIFDNMDSYQTNGYQVQGDTYTISSIGSYDSGNDRTPIVVTASNPDRSCYAVSSAGWQSKLIMCSRNLEIADPGTILSVYYYNTYTERIRFDNNQATGNTKILFKNCMFYGWDYAVDAGFNFQGVNLSFVSNNNGINSGTNHQVTGDFISNNTGFYQGKNHQLTGDFVSNGYGINSGTNHQVTCDFVSNQYGVNSGTNNQVTGDFVSNQYGVQTLKNGKIVGRFINSSITSNATVGNVLKTIISNGDITNSTIAIQLSGEECSLVLEDCTISGTNRRSLRIYETPGNILPIISGESNWQTPSSNNDYIMQAVPNSYCNTGYVGKLTFSPLQPMAYYAAAVSQTLTLKIYPLAYTTALTQADVRLEVSYLDTASGVSRTTVYNTSQTYNNNGWRDCSVTFTPAQAGIVYFNLIFMKYESGATVLIDPVWTVA